MTQITKARPGVAFLAAAIVCVAVALAAGLLLGTQLDDADVVDPPKSESVDAGFARDMKAHHAQAVEMSLLVRDATDDPDIRRLALDIMTTQQQQIGQMYAWLDLWNLSQTSNDSPMAWMPAGTATMDHDMTAMATGSQSMPGMATDEDLRRLAAAEGKAAEKLYLELMIPHHKGGVVMARAAADAAETPQVRRLAQGIVDAQSAEIRYLERLLADRGGKIEE